MSQSAQSPLARLILFIVCLSIAGSIVAGVHYVVVDLPQQNAVQAPTNQMQLVTVQYCSGFYAHDAVLFPICMNFVGEEISVWEGCVERGTCW